MILTTDIDFGIGRSTVEAIYNQICADLEEAVRILPVKYTDAPRISDNLNNYINKGAAQAVLAAVYMARAGYPLLIRRNIILKQLLWLRLLSVELKREIIIIN